MLHRLTDFLRLLWRALYRFFGDGCPGSAAALSFYTFFSLPALLALLLQLVGRFTDPARVQGAIVSQVERLIGGAGATQVATILQRVRDASSGASLTAVLSIVFLAFGATTAFAQLQSALNQAWEVKADPRRNQVKMFLAKRVFSFGLVLALAFLLLVSLAVTTLLAAFGDYFVALLPSPAWRTTLGVATVVFSLAVMTALFAVMFRYLPDARVAWRSVWAGALATALLFGGGREVIGYYFGRADPGTVYGAAGSLAVVLIWVYYSSMIILYGAEFTRVWADAHGEGVQPEPGAVRKE